MAPSGLSPWSGSQKVQEAEGKGGQKDSRAIEPPTRDPKKILVGYVISLHGPQKPWPDKDTSCLCTVGSRAPGHPGLPCRQLGEAVLEKAQGTRGVLLTAPAAGSCFPHDERPHLPLHRPRHMHTHVRARTHTHTHTHTAPRTPRGEAEARRGLCQEALGAKKRPPHERQRLSSWTHTPLMC